MVDLGLCFEANITGAKRRGFLMNRTLAAVALATAFLFQTPANATVITVLPEGDLHNLFGDPEARFNSLPQTPYHSTSPTAGSFHEGGAHFTGGGLIMKNPGQDSLGLYAEPLGDKSKYLAILGGRQETLTYHHDMDRFGLYWGSVDAYNTISFFDGKKLVESFTGSSIIPLIANGNQIAFSSNRYVEFTSLPWFDRVVLGSSQNSFEVDNISASAAPEIATWAMMLVGFAGIGFVAYRRAKKSSAAIAAA
jgi:fibronectin-binding autotransporter adhesin